MTLRCLLIIVVLVNCARVESETRKCSQYDTAVITLNSGDKPFWYQASLGTCINGNEFRDIKVRTLNLDEAKYEYTSFDSLEVYNFPDLVDIFLDNRRIRKIPKFWNLPKIKKISLSNNKLTEISENAFSQIQAPTLIFSSNSISKIADGSFGASVEEVFLTCNNLSVFSPSWFLNPSKVKQINVGGNKITTIPDNTFKDFTSLDRLTLRNNLIKTLGTGSLSGPTKMTFLSLSYNLLLDIKPDVFAPTVTIDYVDVQYNKLSFLHQALMDKITVKQFLTWGNPWQCPCLDVINNWIKKHNPDFQVGLSRDEDPSCVYALSFKDSCVPFPDEELYKTFLINFKLSPVKFC